MLSSLQYPSKPGNESPTDPGYHTVSIEPEHVSKVMSEWLDYKKHFQGVCVCVCVCVWGGGGGGGGGGA